LQQKVQTIASEEPLLSALDNPPPLTVDVFYGPLTAH